MAVIEVVKYNGTPDVFAWKYPGEELGTWTQLIVNESQEAILFKNGMALDVFPSGRYTLDTENIPLLRKLMNMPFGGRSPFTAEIWFVNLVSSLNIKWGTASPIQLQDPKYGIFVPVRSYGQFGIQIVDSKQFLIKLVGTLPVFDKTNLTQYFRGLYITKVKDTVSSYLVHKGISILEINAYLDELSEYMKDRIEPVMEDYGIELVNFYVNDINVPEEDPAVVKLKEALSKRAEMNIIGYSYQQERSFDTLEGVARKESAAASGFMGAGLELGVGAAAGSAFGGQFASMGGILNVEKEVPRIECPSCHAQIEKGMAFCPECGFQLEGKKKPFTCSACGEILIEGVKFCPHCGRRLNPCPNCGADIPEGKQVCPNCHAEILPACPKCGKMLPIKNAKFCPECGARLTRHCPKCGTEVGKQIKFCPECGEKLESED
ncbi:SPFH domain-containing protein [Holdemania massiliensis]|uniref:SPFH domain-containing protein n=1 Tax=Holdemania massiliensis TaxID=1468449 RepID=UPI001F0691AE|nr:SPFH domain-containing protein [Holdemania massiliensis]MCH1939621.1 SPFH domain-containing protein [Holdemania massiliensis]